MKIGIITADFPPEISGAGHLYYDLSQDLVSKGHDVTVITRMPRKKLGALEKSILGEYDRRSVMKENMDGIKVIRVTVPKIPLDNPVAKGIAQFSSAFSQWVGSFFAFRPDVVLCYSPPLPCALSASLFARRHSVPFVLNVQDITPQTAIDVGLMTNNILIKSFEWLERHLYKHADHIIVHSQGNKDYLAQKRGVPDSKLSVGHNWVDIHGIKPGARNNAFRREHGLGDLFIVSYTGTMGWAQNVNTIVEAAALLQEYKDILFLLVGDGPSRQDLQEKCEALRLSNVRFLPFQPRNKYPMVLQASDVSTISLNSDLSTPVVPGKLMDIMSAGLPVLGCVPLTGDAPRIVEEAQSGFCVESNDATGFADRVLKLYNRRDMADTFGRNGRKYVEKYLARDICTGRYEEILKEAVRVRGMQTTLQ